MSRIRDQFAAERATMHATVAKLRAALSEKREALKSLQSASRSASQSGADQRDASVAEARLLSLSSAKSGVRAPPPTTARPRARGRAGPLTSTPAPRAHSWRSERGSCAPRTRSCARA